MKRKIIYITLGNFSRSAGHTARLAFELNQLASKADIYVLSLTSEDVSPEVKERYPRVSFSAFPIVFDGWSVVNIKDIVKHVSSFITFHKLDAVVLTIEIWDLIINLQQELCGRVSFSCTCHAMPFLAAPENPSGDYERDIAEYITQDIPGYRKKYIEEHSRELPVLMQLGLLIANNATVGNYFKTYFPEGKFWEQVPHPTVSIVPAGHALETYKFDLCYMARMEKGKGVEYLHNIFVAVSEKLGRKVSVVIAGRTDDMYAQDKLEYLLQYNGRHYNVSYVGWADNNTKLEILLASRCFVYPSRYDNYPTVVHEALAAGLPVVMWNSFFRRANYEDTKAVLASPLDDTDSFALNVVAALAQNKALGLHAKNFIDSFSNQSKLADADIELIEKIIHYHDNQR